MVRRLLALTLTIVVPVGVVAQTQGPKPTIPPGPPSRGFAVALLSEGIDYRRPAIAAKLARDGEGVIVGWDAIDGDQRPFLADGPATRLVELSPTLIAPFRLDLASAASWERALLVLARTPARVAVVSAPPSQLVFSGRWDAPMVARPEILFIVPADDEPSVQTAAANVIVVASLRSAGQPTAGRSGVDLILAAAATTREAPLGHAAPTTPEEAAILLPGVFACMDLKATKSPAEVKRALIARAAVGPPGAPPLLGLCR